MIKKQDFLRFFCGFCSLLFWQTAVFAQHFDNGLPENLIKNPIEQYKDALTGIRERTASERELKQNFYLENIYLVNGLLKSGIVSQDNDFTALCKGVMKNLTKNDAEIDKKIKYYIVESVAVNAFSTFDGSIFLCRGLLARITTEAQLAFILGHEYIHIREQHAFNIYEHAEMLSKRTPSIRILRSNTEVGKSLFQKAKFGKIIELEADIHGFTDYFAQSGYSIAAINQTLDLLRYSYLPPQKNEVFDLNKILFPVDTQILKKRFSPKIFKLMCNYRLPAAYYIDEPRNIMGENEHQNDSLATHPNLATRRATMRGMLDSLHIPAGTGRDFISFNQKTWSDWLHQKNKYTLPLLYLEQHDILKTIYTTENNDDIYASIIVAKALLKLTLFKNNDEEIIDAEDENYEYLEGEIQRLAYCLAKMDAKEINALTLHYIFILKEYDRLINRFEDAKNLEVNQTTSFQTTSFQTTSFAKNSKTIDFLAKKALEEWVKYHSQDPDYFYDETFLLQKQKTTATTAGSFGNEPSFLTKIDKEYTHYALQFLNTQPENEATILLTQALISALPVPLSQQKEENSNTKQKLNENVNQVVCEKFDFKKVVVVNPTVILSDMRPQKSKLFFETTEKNLEFNELLEKNAKLVGLKTELLAINKLKTSDTTKFEDIQTIKKWVTENLDYGSIDFYDNQGDNLSPIFKKYNADCILLTGVTTVRRPKDIGTAAGFWLGSLVMFPLLPYAVYYSTKPDYDTLFYAILYEKGSNKAKLVKYEFMKRPPTAPVLNLHLYDLLLQLHAK